MMRKGRGLGRGRERADGDGEDDDGGGEHGLAMDVTARVGEDADPDVKRLRSLIVATVRRECCWNLAGLKPATSIDIG